MAIYNIKTMTICIKAIKSIKSETIYNKIIIRVIKNMKTIQKDKKLNI